MIRAARLTGVPKRSSSRRSIMPRCRPKRTRKRTPFVALTSFRDLSNVTVAFSASTGSSKAAYIPSPVIFTTTPRLRSTAARDNASCFASAGDIVSLCSSHSRVLPSISVNRRVATLVDTFAPTFGAVRGPQPFTLPRANGDANPMEGVAQLGNVVRVVTTSSPISCRRSKAASEEGR
jgi:hypothetical protein